MNSPLDNKQIKKPKPGITLWLNTTGIWEHEEKHEAQTSVFYICRVMSQMSRVSEWIRIVQWIDVCDVKFRFAHGWHRVGVEEGNSLKGKERKNIL